MRSIGRRTRVNCPAPGVPLSYNGPLPGGHRVDWDQREAASPQEGDERDL